MKEYIKKVRLSVRNITKTIINYLATRHIAQEYHESLRAFDVSSRQKDTVIAVVIHLYYTDNWPLFKKKLRNISSQKFDIFITIPKQNTIFIDEIRKVFPAATVLTVPNHGRDVVPFLQVARVLKQAGYEIVLKFHSKKSTHRADGQEWLEDMLNKLLPSDNELVNSLVNKLQQPNTGIVGPSDVYYPLTVNFPANGLHMTRALKKLYGSNIAYNILQRRRKEYGFFAGTMLWMRLDAIDKLLDFPVWYFEQEKGQIDATFAHAIERLLCLIAEIDQKKIYEISSTNIMERTYQSENIPDWSEDHDK